jgi:hypothetical protein
MAGTSYRVRLATSVGGSVVVEAEMSFATNEPPTMGTLVVIPAVGTALNTTFMISATNFVDSHLPLTYRFGYERSLVQRLP